MKPIATDESIDSLLGEGAAVACGVSGGKDSVATALAVYGYLDARGHRGQRVLIHSDLGMVEWAESLPVCEELARHLNTELVVVRRAAGGMMERWERRWASSIKRYSELKTVTLVPPWSTPSMRFCTSELKTHVINKELRKRFSGVPIINVTGIRRDESSKRASSAVATYDEDQSSPNTPYWHWRPLVDWNAKDTFAAIAEAGLKPHPGYTEWGMSRISCAFCIMSNSSDLTNSARNPAHVRIYKRMCALEAASAFSFQKTRWLSDVAPALLGEQEREATACAKLRRDARVAAESRIPRRLLYKKGWPNGPITYEDAELLCGVRNEVSTIAGITLKVQAPEEIVARYEELLKAKEVSRARKRRRRRGVCGETASA